MATCPTVVFDANFNNSKLNALMISPPKFPAIEKK